MHQLPPRHPPGSPEHRIGRDWEHRGAAELLRNRNAALRCFSDAPEFRALFLDQFVELVYPAEEARDERHEGYVGEGASGGGDHL